MLSPDQLKDKQRRLREHFPENLGLRVHRAISWLKRASEESEDPDVAFILLWIAFNASYSEELDHPTQYGEREIIREYFDKILRLDHKGVVFDAIWKRFYGPIQSLLDNKFIFKQFWNHHNGLPGFDQWEQSFDRSKHKIKQGLTHRDTPLILSILFDRLYVLRNQLIHGGATWNSSINRKQVEDGCEILEFLLQYFVDIMMDHPNEPWGRPFYPVLPD